MNKATKKRLALLEERLTPATAIPGVVVCEQDDGTLRAFDGEIFASVDVIHERWPERPVVIFTVVDGRRKPAEGEEAHA